MEIHESNVLQQVEVFFKKLDKLPSDVKEAAMKRIEEKLSLPSKGRTTDRKEAAAGKSKQGRGEEVRTKKKRVQVKACEDEEAKEANSFGMVVEEVVTKRGRKAKRINYSLLMKEDDEVKKSNITENSLGECKTDDVDDYGLASDVKVPLAKAKYDDKDDTGFSEEGKPKKKSMAKGKPVSRKKYTEKDLICQYCNYRCAHRSQVLIHERRHTGMAPYECPECGKRFNQSSGLTVHLKRHRGQRDFQCDFCRYRSFTKIDLIRHQSMHTGERNHVCQHCGKAFTKDSTLREHVRSIHEKSKKYECSQCAFVTYRSSNLQVHIRIRHQGEYNNHVCPICNSRLKHRQAFIDHMRRHTGEKPFHCGQCQSTFATQARLNVHMRSVHLPRSFPCSTCPKTFQTKHHLERHVLTHTDTKPFSCPFCSYSCNTQGNVTKHIKTVHNKWDFSFRRFREEQSGEAEKKLDPEWLEKGRKVTNVYLKQLSEKLGKEVTLGDLKIQEEERKKKAEQEMSRAKMRRLNRSKGNEHCYHINRTAAETSEPPLESGTVPPEPIPEDISLPVDAVPPTAIPQLVHIQTPDGQVQQVEAILLGDVLHLPSGETIPVLRETEGDVGKDDDYLTGGAMNVMDDVSENGENMKIVGLEELEATDGVYSGGQDTVVVIINTDEDQISVT